MHLSNYFEYYLEVWCVISIFGACVCVSESYRKREFFTVWPEVLSTQDRHRRVTCAVFFCVSGISGISSCWGFVECGVVSIDSFGIFAF